MVFSQAMPFSNKTVKANKISVNLVLIQQL